jgi:hypothetical protein
MAPRRSTRTTAKAAASTEEPVEEAPKAVKAKKTEAKKKAAPKANKTTKEEEPDEAPKANKTTKEEAPEEAPEEEVAKTGISVTIEACKTCGVMTKVKTIVKALEGKADAVINPEEPGKGNFVIRVNGGEPIVELLAMKRPFTSVKELDTDELIAKLLQAVAEATPAL